MSLFLSNKTFSDRLRYAAYSIKEDELTNDFSRIGVCVLQILQSEYMHFLQNPMNGGLHETDRENIQQFIDEFTDFVTFCENGSSLFNSFLVLCDHINDLIANKFVDDSMFGGDIKNLIEQAMMELE